MNWKVSIFGVCPSVSLRYPPHGKTSLPLLLRGSQEKEQRIFHPFWYSLKMGIEKGRPSEQSPKMKGIFYEAMQEKKLSESPKPLILLGFSKSSVSPLGPEKEQPLSCRQRLFLFNEIHTAVWVKSSSMMKSPAGIKSGSTPDGRISLKILIANRCLSPSPNQILCAGLWFGFLLSVKKHEQKNTLLFILVGKTEKTIQKDKEK